MQLLTLDEVAARLGVCRRMAENLLASGRLPPPVRFGRARRWSDAQVDGFISAEVERAGGSLMPATRARRGPGRPRSGQ